MSKYLQITGFDVYECNDKLYLNERAAKAAQEQQAIIDGKLYPIEHCQAELTTGNPYPTTVGIIPREAQEAYLNALMDSKSTPEEMETHRKKLIESAVHESIHLDDEPIDIDRQIVTDSTGTKLYKERIPR